MQNKFMSTTSGKNNKSGKKPTTSQKGQRKVAPDLSKDPYFVRKNEEAVAFIKKVGLPKDFITKGK